MIDHGDVVTGIGYAVEGELASSATTPGNMLTDGYARLSIVPSPFSSKGSLEDATTALFSSKDGETWTKGATVWGNYDDSPLETEIELTPKGKMLALVRMDGDAFLLWSMHFAWFVHDTRPPVWDMALHQTYALNYLQGQMLEPDAPVDIWAMSGNYPPFVHLVIAVVFWILHPGPHIAALANIPATLLLFWAICELGRDLAGPLAARWACILVALTPYLIWISRETILDYWLSAWFAAALFFLHRSKGFQSRPWGLLLGVVLALGLLTKWFFAGLILIPLIYVFFHFRVWKDSARLVHLFEALFVGATARCTASSMRSARS